MTKSSNTHGHHIGDIHTGDKYYDEYVFPKLVKGEKTFNWYAAMFGAFWFPYKGMWKSWLVFYAPLVVASSFFENTERGSVLALVFWILTFVAVGKTANEKYFSVLKRENRKSNTWAGVGGIALYLFALITCSLFWSKFTVFQDTRNGPKVNLEEAKQIRNLASVKIYSSAALAILDGDSAIGNKVKIAGLYLGLQPEDGTPFLMVQDSSGGGHWLIGFVDKYKSMIPSLRVGGSYTFECTIESIDTGINYCIME